MADNAFHLRWKNHQLNMNVQLDSLFIHQSLVDVTISCKDGTLKAHKVILSACSPYFESVFKENPCKHPVLIMKGVCMREMKCLLEFMYKGAVSVLEEELQSLINTASDLQIRGLAYDLMNEAEPITMHGSSRGHDVEMTSSNLLRMKPRSESRPTPIKQEQQLDDDESLEAASPSVPSCDAENFQDNEEMSVDHEETSKSCNVETRYKGLKHVDVTGKGEGPVMLGKSKDCQDLEKNDGACYNNSVAVKTEVEDTDPSQPTDPDMESKFSDTVCPYCYHHCHTASDLKRHMRTHTVEKTHNCDFCKLAFARASHLARHRRVHTGERPFTCPSCDRTFSRQDKLKQHIRRHHGTEPQVKQRRPRVEKPRRPRGRPRKVVVPASEGIKADPSGMPLPFGDTSFLSSLTLGRQRYDLACSENRTEDLLHSVRQLGECTIQTLPGSQTPLTTQGE